MSYEFIKVEKEDRITVVTINRPEVMNALHPPANRELDQVFNEFANSPDDWVAIITGASDQAFCAGNDLKWQARKGNITLKDMRKFLTGGFGGITERFDCYKPIIAAVNGFAMGGGGMEIVLACDIVVAAEHATFGLPEPRVGMVAAGGGIQRLSRQISYHQAMGMMMTGRKISAQEVYTLGIINEIAPSEGLMIAARRWAEEILECAPLSVRASKEAALKGLDLSLSEAIKSEFPGIAAMCASEDFIEGPLAFSQKRKPKWKGS